jgi:hypothetical protein
LTQGSPALRCAFTWRSLKWNIAPDNYELALRLIERLCTEEPSDWSPDYILADWHPYDWAPWVWIARAIRDNDQEGLDSALAEAKALYSPLGYRIVVRGYTKWTETWQLPQADILRDLFSPFRPVVIDPAWLAWLGGLIPQLARALYDERDPESGRLDNARLAVLADALEEAGCCDPAILDHCRGPGPHYRGCHVVGAILSPT